MTDYPKSLDELTTIYQQIAKKQGDSFDWFSNVCYGGYPVTHSKEIDLPINKGVTFTPVITEDGPVMVPDLVRIVLGNGNTQQEFIEIPYELYRQFLRRSWS